MGARPDSEQALYEAIVRLLTFHRVHVTRLAQPRATKQTPGVPDLWLMWTGGLPMGHVRGSFAELKTSRGRLSAAQRAWHEAAHAAGIPVEVWRSLDDVLNWLTAIGLRRAAS